MAELPLIAWILDKVFAVGRWLRGQWQLSTGGAQPPGTTALHMLKRKLYTGAHEHGGGELAELRGRTEQLDQLLRECRNALQSPSELRVVSVWGPQGIGKTHLLYAFASALVKGAYPSMFHWKAWQLNREFDAKTLCSTAGKGLPHGKPVLLLWDDVSLSDESTKTSLDALRSACASRTHPVVLMLTTWQRQEGHTAHHRQVDSQVECPSLSIDDAQHLYPHAQQLPHGWQGHPLLLRMLHHGNVSPATFAAGHNAADIQAALWALCRQSAAALVTRYQVNHRASPTALRAVAIASSSDALAETQAVRNVLHSYTQQDANTLKALGLLAQSKGMRLIQPIRPDLIGWAFALEVLGDADIQATQWREWATTAWCTDFFDTGRFVVFATAHAPEHPWVQQLKVPQLGNRKAALHQAKAATNAVADLGGAQRWAEMQAELAVSQAIAQRYEDDREIQLRYARCLLVDCMARDEEGDAAQGERVAALLRCLQQHPGLQEQAPFNTSRIRARLGLD